MAFIDWSEKNIIERFQNAKEEFGIDDVPAALLVLAYSVEVAGVSMGITDSDGVVNVNVQGGIETTQAK